MQIDRRLLELRKKLVFSFKFQIQWGIVSDVYLQAVAFYGKGMA